MTSLKTAPSTVESTKPVSSRLAPTSQCPPRVCLGDGRLRQDRPPLRHQRERGAAASRHLARYVVLMAPAPAKRAKETSALSSLACDRSVELKLAVRQSAPTSVACDLLVRSRDAT